MRRNEEHSAILSTFIKLPFVIKNFICLFLSGRFTQVLLGAQWLSCRVLFSRPKDCGFKRHCVVSLSKNINPSLVLVQPRKTRPYITERLLMGHKESNQRNTGVTVCSILLTGV